MSNAAKDEIDWNLLADSAENIPSKRGGSEDFEVDWNVLSDETQTGMPAFTDDVALVADAPSTDDVASFVADLAAVAQESVSNAGVGTIGSIAGGQLRGVGFSTSEGYVDAMRRGVPAATYRQYETTLRTRYNMTTADLAKLNLPGPMAQSVLPVGPGIVHTPTGSSIFDRPAAERTFMVGPKPTGVQTERVEFRAGDLVAGAVAEGHHIIINWDGTSGTTRGQLYAALDAIGRADLAPDAPEARAQAGAAVELLKRRGYDVDKAPCNIAGEHRWTVGKVNHAGNVGDEYGRIRLVLKLTGAVMSYDAGDNVESAALGAEIVAAFNARTAGEIFKSGKLSPWVAETLRIAFRAVKRGSLGWLIPRKYAIAAQEFCGAVRTAGFGEEWELPGMPVATCDQLRDGIVRGLAKEVSDLLQRLATERATAKAQKLLHPTRAGEVGKDRIATYLTDLRVIGKRTIAYGQLLGEHRVAALRETIRQAAIELEMIHGADYSGIEERFALIWEEIREDQMRAEVL